MKLEDKIIEIRKEIEKSKDPFPCQQFYNKKLQASLQEILSMQQCNKRKQANKLANDVIERF